MLTADLVHARKQGKELRLVKLDEKARAHAAVVADAMLGAFSAHVGRTRDELDEALDDVETRLAGSPSARRTAAGLRKLLDDEAEWATGEGALDPPTIRRAVFVAAAAARKSLGDEHDFDREALLARVASELGSDPELVERALYSDLRSAHRLQAAPALTAPMLVERWEAGQAQAVLLRAVRVTVWISCASAAAYRAVFHRLKFLRLLHEVHRVGDDEAWPDAAAKSRKGGHRIVIDGPFSLFESVTKYGLQLAMLVPALRACDAFHLEAEVRWGATRAPLTFRLDGGARGRDGETLARPEEIDQLLASFQAVASDWTAQPSPDVLDLPGIGLCVPDVLFVHRDGTRVFLEVLGFWSREAVFRRIELVERGLPHKILFAVSKRLRVREDLLEEGLPGALYVYKGTPSARTILERLEAMRARAEVRAPGRSSRR